MFKILYFLLVSCITFKSSKCIIQVWTYSNPVCADNPNIQANVYSYTPYYDVVIAQGLKASTQIKVRFDSEGSIVLDTKDSKGKNISRFTSDPDFINNVFIFTILEDVGGYKFQVVGKLPPEHPPYLISLKINGEEKCGSPTRTVFDKFPKRVEDYWPAAPDNSCGRRRIYKKHTELIVSGSATQSGYWPWHVAIYDQLHILIKYRCGGTLLSTLLVLTAAHCVTKNGAPINPELINVVLGKFSLIGTEVTAQEKEVFRIIVHDDFDHRKLNNDIALIKLVSEAKFNNYVQPACLWFDDIYDQLDSYEIKGTVVGWGFDQTETTTNELRETTMPLVPELVCIRYDPVFYSNMLNGNKFCAGYNNGTSACNGDSGGGFVVFVPDVRTSLFSYPREKRPGAWYVKGIVSVTLVKEDLSLCDPKAYTVFTDVAKYRSWILRYLK